MAYSAEYLADQARTDAIVAEFAERCRSQAVITVARTIKSRARDYQARPAMLEILYPGLCCCEPRRMIAIGEALLEAELYARLDFIPVKRLNAKAVILLDRFNRRFAAPQSAPGLRTTIFAEAL